MRVCNHMMQHIFSNTHGTYRCNKIDGMMDGMLNWQMHV